MKTGDKWAKFTPTLHINFFVGTDPQPYHCTVMRATDDFGQVLVISGGSGYNDLINATDSAIFVLPGTW